MKKVYSGKRIVITGGLGMLGSSLAHRLTNFDSDVLLIDNYMDPYGANDTNIEGIIDKIKINIADIRDKSSMNKLLQGMDFVFDFAAQVGHGISMENPGLDLDINCLGHLNVLQACRNGSPNAKIFFSGSRFQFGRILKNPVDENHPMLPLSIYGIHKLAGEHYFLAFNKHYNMDTVIFRIANPYGPRSQMKHSQYSMVNWFLRNAMDNKEITIFGEGSQVRDYIFIDDLVEAFLAAGATVKSKGQVYNVGSGTGTKFIDMANTIVETACSGKVVQVPWPEYYESIETGDYITDIGKIKEHTGWIPEISFKRGIRKTFEYYSHNRDKYWKP